MKLIIYSIGLVVFAFVTDISSPSYFEGVISPILAVIFLFLFIAKLLRFLGITGGGKGNGGGGGFFGGDGGGFGDGGCGGDGGGC